MPQIEIKMIRGKVTGCGMIKFSRPLLIEDNASSVEMKYRPLQRGMDLRDEGAGHGPAAIGGQTPPLPAK